MDIVLVTGGAGFIGSHLARKLVQAGYRVRILDNLSPQIHGALPRGLDWIGDPAIEFVRGSIVGRDDVERALTGVRHVVHLAAETGTGQSMYQIARYNEVNAQGTALLMDALGGPAGASVERVVLSSSRSVYGEGAYTAEGNSAKRTYPTARSAAQLANGEWEHRCMASGQLLQPAATREDDQARPVSIYAATKLAQEDLVRIGCEALNRKYIILRLQNVYGEGQSLHNPYTGILSVFSTRIRRQLTLPVFEDGLETRDFVHVDDVAEAMLRSLVTPDLNSTTINVGSGEGTTVLDVAHKLSKALGKQAEIKVTGQFRLGDIRHNRADITRLKEQLDFVPTILLNEGLQRFAAWVLSQPLPEDQLEIANQELRDRKLMG